MPCAVGQTFQAMCFGRIALRAVIPLRRLEVTASAIAQYQSAISIRGCNIKKCHVCCVCVQEGDRGPRQDFVAGSAAQWPPAHLQVS